MSWIRARLTYANVAASIALFGVLAGGGAYAASKIGSKQIKRNAIATKHIKKNAVKPAEIADGAVTASEIADGGVTGSEIADGGVTGSEIADGGVTAEKIADGAVAESEIADGAVTPSKIAGASEAYHEVGAPGEPGFGEGWSNDNPSAETTAAFYKDPFDVVHLKGIVFASSDAEFRIFTLPQAYRPTKNACFPTVRELEPSTSESAFVCVLANGDLEMHASGGDSGFLLDGITFRAGTG